MHSAFTWQPLCYTESFPPPLFLARETTTTTKTLFCFALHLSFWRLWWFFWWRSIVFATVALDELPEVNVQITSTRSDRIFFVPLFNIFFCSGIITAQPSEVDGDGRAMDRERPPHRQALAIFEQNSYKGQKTKEVDTFNNACHSSTCREALQSVYNHAISFLPAPIFSGKRITSRTWLIDLCDIIASSILTVLSDDPSPLCCTEEVA